MDGWEYQVNDYDNDCQRCYSFPSSPTGVPPILPLPAPPPPPLPPPPLPLLLDSSFFLFLFHVAIIPTQSEQELLDA